jgi:ribosomal protein S18 acetylase RimI-like enzyme
VEFSIRPANLDDYGIIARFLNEKPFVHRHLDWRTPLDWLGSQPYLLLENKGVLAAVLACPPEPPEVAWVRLFAVDPTCNTIDAWISLVDRAYHLLEYPQKTHFVALGLQDWFEQLLVLSPFEVNQSIVVMEWDESMPLARSLPKGLVIRPMTASDLPTVQRLDELAFAPIWQHSESALVLALAQTSVSTVAEIDHQVVAYQMSTSYVSSGHLARLAVHPDFQRRSIAYSLVRHLLLEFKHRSVWRVTVNTQNDNQASQNLYHTLGFHLTGEEFRVYEYTAAGQTV